MHHKTTPEQRAAAVERVRNGEPRADVARDLGIKAQSLAKFLRRAGVPKAQEPHPALTDAEVVSITQRYQRGSNTPQIALDVGRSLAAVVAVIKDAGLMLGPGEGRRRRVPTDQRDAFVAAYEDGATLREAAATTGVSVTVVRNEMTRRGIARRPAGHPGRFDLESDTAKEILTYYAAGHRIGTLTEWFDCSSDAVTTLLKRAGITRRKADTGGYAWTDKRGRDFVFRSSWELKVADWLDEQNATWDYEVETFKLPGTYYTPDFWIYVGDVIQKIVDVKGAMFASCARRIEMFKEAHPAITFELWNEPWLQARGILDRPLPPHETSNPRAAHRTRPQMRRQIVRLYEETRSVDEIEDATGVDARTVMRIVREAGVTQDKSERKRERAASTDLRDLIAADYATGMSIRAVAKARDTTPDIVYEEIKRRGIARTKPRYEWTPERLQRLSEMRAVGTAMSTIAAALETTIAVVQHRLASG